MESPNDTYEDGDAIPDSISDADIIKMHGDQLTEQMDEYGLEIDYEDGWSDQLVALLVRKYRVPDGPERIFIDHQIDGLLARAAKARAAQWKARPVQEAGRLIHGVKND